MNFLWFLEGIRTPAGNEFFQFVTCFGQEPFLLAIICCFYWCFNKTFACQLGLTYFSSGLLVQSMKITFQVPRPWILDPDFTPVKKRRFPCHRLLFSKWAHPGRYLSVCTPCNENQEQDSESVIYRSISSDRIFKNVPGCPYAKRCPCCPNCFPCLFLVLFQIFFQAVLPLPDVLYHPGALCPGSPSLCLSSAAF